MKNYSYDFNKETGVSVCILKIDDNIFIGEAYCHEDDMDMLSEFTGCEIATARANIKYLNHVRDNEIKPSLKALNQYYYSINKSKKFNEKSYEFKMLKRQIKKLENDLITIQQELLEEKRFLKTYIQGKEKIFQTIRTKRQDKSN